jgi:hypothetical protein
MEWQKSEWGNQSEPKSVGYANKWLRKKAELMDGLDHYHH